MITASRDQIQDGGTLRLAIEQYPSNFNPMTTDGNSVAVQPIQEMTLPDYFDLTEDGQLTPNPDYLVSAEVVSQDPFVTEFVLNPKAVWSNGTPIGYDDFLANWEASNGSKSDYQPTSLNGWEKISKIEKGSDDYHIKVTWTEPYAAWKFQFNGIVPAALCATAKLFTTGWKNGEEIDGQQISGGPFIIQKADATAQNVTLVPNPKWWGDAPKLSSVVLRAIAPAQWGNAFANGEIAALNISNNADLLKTAEGVKDTTILRAVGVGQHFIDFNAQSPILKDLNVRTAVAMGINREAIANTRLSPVGAPPTVLNNHLYTTGQAGYEDNGDAVVPYDPQKAGAMLDAAGWTMGPNGYRVKDGKELTLTEVIPTGTPTQTQTSQQITAMLKQIGVNVKVEPVVPQHFFDQYVDKGNYDIAYFGSTGGVYPECGKKSQFYPATLGGQNKTGISTEEIGKLFDQTCSTLDDTARTQLGNQLDQQIWALVANITVFTDPSIAAVKSNLANYDGYSSAFQTPRWQDVGFLKQ